MATDTRSASYTQVLHKIDNAVKDCQKCGGTGMSKIAIRSRLANFSVSNELEDNENRAIKRRQKMSIVYAQSKKENLSNSSYGLCRCRIKAERLKSIIISSIPVEIDEIEFKDVNRRDVLITNRTNVDLRRFVKYYLSKFEEAKRLAIGCNFFGTGGAGKTFVSQFLAARIIRKRYTAHYAPLFTLLDLVNTYYQENTLLQEIMNVDFLVIDDIGYEQVNRRKFCGELAFFLQQRNDRKKVNLFIFNELKKRNSIIELYGSAFSHACEKKNMDIVFRTKVTDDRVRLAQIGKLLRRL